VRPQGSMFAMATELRIGEERHTIAFADALRNDVRSTLDQLNAMGVRSSIISGDRAEAVEGIAAQIGIRALAAMKPAEKLAELERLKAAGHFPLMVGDGLNDGPALAAAHASIAPGTASDASQQAADAVFIGSRLAPVAMAVQVARATMRIVRQNFAFAVIYNFLAVPMAMAGMVTPMIAAIAMSVSSLVVVANSLRLASAAR
jgi:P-type Cu2+ transporter